MNPVHLEWYSAGREEGDEIVYLESPVQCTRQADKTEKRVDGERGGGEGKRWAMEVMEGEIAGKEEKVKREMKRRKIRRARERGMCTE